jgi:hypothetical protein
MVSIAEKAAEHTGVSGVFAFLWKLQTQRLR